MNSGPAQVVPLHSHDKRVDALAQALVDIIHERGDGLALVTVLGTMRMVESFLIREHTEFGG